MSETIGDWAKRGKIPMGRSFIEDIVSYFPFLPPPKNVVMLDGVIDVEGRRTAVGAYPVLSNYVMLTPLSNEKTFIHEWLHQGLGVGERIAYPLSERMYARYMSGLAMPRLRQVSYEESPLKVPPEQFVRMLGLDFETIELPPEIRHYRLIGEPTRRLQLLG